MTRHHATMEAGGWLLLVAAIIALLYLLFGRKGQGQSVTDVSSRLITGAGDSIPTGPPSITPTDPTQQATYRDPNSGTIYAWDTTGQQWYPITKTPVNVDSVGLLPTRYSV